MPRPGQKIVEGLLKPLFKERGFLKTGQTWRRETPEFIQVFNLQASQFSDSYMFNCGIAARTPTTSAKLGAASCDVHYRMDTLQRDEATDIDFLDMTNAMDLQVRSHRIAANALKGIAWMEKMSSRQAILDLVARQKKNRNSDTGVSMRRGGFAYIGQPLAPFVPPVPSTTVSLIAPDGTSFTIDKNDKKALNESIKQIMATAQPVSDLESLMEAMGIAPKKNPALPQLYFLTSSLNQPEGIPPIGFLSEGRLAITQPARALLERSGLTGLTFIPSSDGTHWEASLQPEGALVSRRDSPTEVTLDFIHESWDGTDFFIAHSTHRPCVSEKAREFLLAHFPNSIELKPIWKVTKRKP